MPEGTRRKANAPFSCTTRCPALLPPWKRTTKSAPIESSSTILPLPSSPHCAPMTATATMIMLLNRFSRKLLCFSTCAVRHTRVTLPQNFCACQELLLLNVTEQQLICDLFDGSTVIGEDDTTISVSL